MQATNNDTERFIGRWRSAGGSERANYQLFVTELCALLGVPLPQPARDDARDNAYVFERLVNFAHGDGSSGWPGKGQAASPMGVSSNGLGRTGRRMRS